jgi:hypothetical protein
LVEQHEGEKDGDDEPAIFGRVFHASLLWVR